VKKQLPVFKVREQLDCELVSSPTTDEHETYFYTVSGSLGFAVIDRQFWRQLHCRPPAVQLLAQLSRKFPMNPVSKQPADRYQSMEEFASALRASLTDKPALRPAPAPKPSRRETTESDTIKDFQPTISANTVPPSLAGKGPGVRSGSRSLLSWTWIGIVALCLPALVGVFFWGGNISSALFGASTPSRTPTSIVTPTDTPDPNEFTDIDPIGNLISMRLIPAGDFIMGSNNSSSDEQPVHTVYLDAYYMDTYEVTNKLYKDCVTVRVCDAPIFTGHYNNSKYENHPVAGVYWTIAKTYCEWRLGSLPTEAQWEKAARGTDARTYPWGEGIDCDKGNYSGCVVDTTEVGSYPSGVSPYGLFDMAGNVWEWVADWYSDTYYASSLSSNPLGPDSGQYRVRRGGSWGYVDNVIRSALRDSVFPSYVGEESGFRCARPAQ
jgi:hypothetical protein